MSADFPKKSRQKIREGLRSRLIARKPNATSKRASILFLTSGVFSLVASIYTGSTTLSLVGLGLVFWGALFLLISPRKRVDARLVYDSVLVLYSNVDRIINQFNYKGKGYYIPPYPKEIYLPEHFSGLKDTLVFISAKAKFDFPSIEELAKSNFLLKNQKGILVNPPGLGFLSCIEKNLRIDYDKTTLSELAETLPRTILTNLDIAEDIEITIKNNQIKLLITKSLYENLYNIQNKSRSLELLGCPIASVVACVLVKATGIPVTIQTYKKSPDGLTTQVEFNIEEGLKR